MRLSLALAFLFFIGSPLRRGGGGRAGLSHT